MIRFGFGFGSVRFQFGPTSVRIIRVGSLSRDLIKIANFKLC